MLDCRHCYKSPVKELGLEQWKGILRQYEDLLAAVSSGRRIPVKARLHLTGGEPFLAKGIWEFLQHIKDRKIEFAMLTTGLALDESEMARLKELGPVFVQVSLDGDAETHDALRGRGNHARVVKAIRKLHEAGLKVSVSFTAMKSNFRQFASVAKTVRTAGACTIWTDRMIPCGENGSTLRHEVMDATEVDAFLDLLHEVRRKHHRSWRRSFRIQTGRALQFRAFGGTPYRCNAGHELIALLPDGTLCPCRRMPIPVGSVMEKDMTTLYTCSPMLKALRQPPEIHGCERCLYAPECHGGLRCLSWAMTGDPFKADPGCRLARREEVPDLAQVVC